MKDIGILQGSLRVEHRLFYLDAEEGPEGEQAGTRNEAKPLQDMRFDARSRDAQGITLPASLVVAVESELSEVSAPPVVRYEGYQKKEQTEDVEER